MSESDDDVPHLSAETFAVLQEFYQEQEEKENAILSDKSNEPIQFQEDWQLSQFWYDEDTIHYLTNLALNVVGENGKIALLSCPSLYKTMKEKASKDTEINLFEYDKRFAVYGSDFIQYDYKFTSSIPKDRRCHYDLVIADPPFLSEECLIKTAVIIKFLTKNKIILCTGAVMEEMAVKLLNSHKTSFTPHHKNNLANEFCCYSNFNIENF